MFRHRFSIRSILLSLLLAAPLAAAIPLAQAQDTTGIDQAALDRCGNTLTDILGMTGDDPSYLDTLTACYGVETGPGLDLPPPTLQPNDVITGFFAPGSDVRVTKSDLDEVLRFRGASSPDGKGDIEALNRARGGSGAYIGPKPVELAAGAPPDPCAELGTLDGAIAITKAAITDTEAHLKSLEKQVTFWSVLDQNPVGRAYLFYTQILLQGLNLTDVLGPMPPLEKAKLIDKNYEKPTPYNFRGEYRYQEEGYGAPPPMSFGDRLAAWEADPQYGQKAAAEKKLYETQTYPEGMAKLEKQLHPGTLDEARLLNEPAKRLVDLRAQQDSDILHLRRLRQNLNVWLEASRKGASFLKCAFPTGPLDHPVAIPDSDPTDQYFAYVLNGIGVVLATEQDVTTRLACQWAGGGPYPCPKAKPAEIVGKLGGPYASFAAAKADLKTKLVCRNGYWGPQAQTGVAGQGLAAGGWSWLQNNVTLDFCKVVQ